MTPLPHDIEQSDLRRRLDELEITVRRLRLDLGTVRFDANMALSRTHQMALPGTNRINPDDRGGGLGAAELTDPDLLQLLIEEQREYHQRVTTLIGDLAAGTRAGFAAAEANAQRIIATVERAS